MCRPPLLLLTLEISAKHHPSPPTLGGYSSPERRTVNVPGASGGVQSGYHDDATWRSFVPDQLEFIRARIG
jgi:hypothetical protein